MIDSPEELTNYCLRKLGAPVINIAIDQTQIDDLIEDALQFFIEYHYDGSTERYVPYNITARDVINGYLTIPAEILEVVHIYDPGIGGSSAGEEFERLNFHLANSDVVDFVSGGPDIASYHMSMEQIATLRKYFSPQRNFTFNKVSHIIRTSGRLVEGNLIFLHAYIGLNPDQDFNIFNDLWLKKYCTQLFKRQWGSNTKKYKNVQLAGGLEMDGQQIFDEAENKLEKLEEEFDEKYTLPPKFFMG